MTILSAHHFEYLAYIATLAVVFSDILTQPKMIFGEYGVWLERLEEKRPKLARLLGYCAKCTAGQVALWVFVVRVVWGWDVWGWCFLRGVCFVSVAILGAAFLSAAYSRAVR